MSGRPGTSRAWERARLAGAVFALDGAGAGIVVQGGPGLARDAWLRGLEAALPPGVAVRRTPATISDDRLLGALDIAATLASGRPVREKGVLEAEGPTLLVLASAERLPLRTASLIAAALDTGNAARGAPGGLSFVALDEGREDDGLAAPLLERAAFVVDLDRIPLREICDGGWDLDAARARLAQVDADDEAVETLVAAATRLGIESLRAPIFALRAARAVAALDGADRVRERHLVSAVELTLAHRARSLPDAPEPAPAPPRDAGDAAPPEAEEDDNAAGVLEDVVVAAAQAAIPPALLAQLQEGRSLRGRSTPGKAGSQRISLARGRPIGARAGSPRRGRVDLIATLVAAAPWQTIRRRESEEAGGRVLVRSRDIRIVRYREPRAAATIFAVDASGSSAAHRLAEAKGAIELLLAECYARRDSVAMIAFRGAGAEVVLPPTRSTARAKRLLAGLPGGGGTPLASGLDAAAALAEHVQRKGQSPLVVLLTDGRANVTRAGGGGRAQAMDEALEAGRRLRAAGVPALAIDTAPPFGADGETPTFRIAEAMQARYVKLPVANAALVSEAVRSTVQRLRT